MKARWGTRELLRELSARGGHPAVISYGDDETLIWDGATLAHNTLKLARRLRQSGIGGGSRVALCAPNSPAWIASALAVLASGAVLAPVDDLADAAQVNAALVSSGARLLLTTARRLDESGGMLSERGVDLMLVDTPEFLGGDAATSVTAPDDRAEDFPVPGDDAPAVLSWTSGTTGTPKAFVLTHGNIATNVVALRNLALVGPQDRALLPLPLHHAYPFVVGLLTPLTHGAAIVLPGGTTGPLLMKALQTGQVTAIVGVPRLYEALEAGIEARLEGGGRAARLTWRTLSRLVIFVRRRTGLCLGRFVFAPVRHAIAPRLRLLVSGGARLRPETEEELETLGWTVLSGYGLAETASLFTGNRPNDRRLGSVGKPLADGEIRIADPDDQGTGEIELRGSSVIGRYLDNPEADRAAFTADGWFRTGDLGHVDRDGFLFVTGRAKEILVLGGGKKVNPEDLERLYGNAPEIAELALLEDKGALVALVRPDPSRLRARGALNFRDPIRILLGEKAQRLPSYQRLSGFALTDQPLPRTRLGKYRRFLLPGLYAQAAGGGVRRAAHVLGPEDEALLRNPAAAAIWSLLRQRYPDVAIDLDVSLSLDLNLDSFGWMELTLLLQERFGVQLSEADITEIETVRDLLRRATERQSQAPTELPAVATDLDRWLAPHGVLLSLLNVGLYTLNWLIMRTFFRLRVQGIEHLPKTGPFVIAANHASYLDGPAIAAALPLRRYRQLYWAGDLRTLFSSRLTRIFARIAHVFPVDAKYPRAALEAAARVLQSGRYQVWFPEGWVSPDGKLQQFQPGIGELLLTSGAPAVPTFVSGTFEALPRGGRRPRFVQVLVAFGRAEQPEALRAAGAGRTEEEKIAIALRERLIALGEPRDDHLAGGPAERARRLIQ